MKKHQDPLVAARFAIGYVWPLLLAMVFSAGLVGPGVTGGVFWVTDPTAVRWIFGLTAVAALTTTAVRRPVVIIPAAGVISIVCLGRAWDVMSRWLDAAVPTTSFLVGAFLWVAVAVAHLLFAGALLAIVNADRSVR